MSERRRSEEGCLAVTAERLHRLKGSQTPVMIVVTYGGRAYEDTLKELKDILEAQGFVCIGAAAVITRHSIVPQIAAGRPNSEDYMQIDEFIDKVKVRLGEAHQSVEVPGNTPYKELHIVPMKIHAAEACIKCGLCSKNCPVNAISIESPQLTDYDKCISCMRCVGICPLKARTGDEVKIGQITAKLKAICLPDKKPEFF